MRSKDDLVRAAIRVLVVAAALVLGASGRLLAQESAEPAAADVIREQEAALATAMYARDAPRMEALLGDDFVLRGPPDLDRAGWIKNAVTLCWGNWADIDDYKSRENGDVTIAWFELTFYLNPVTCRPAVMRSLITDVWVRRDDRWQLQIRHGAPPPVIDAGLISQYGMVPLPPAPWEVSSEFSLIATGGNTSTRTLGMGGDLIHRTAKTTTRSTVSYLSSEVDEVPQARSLTLLLRHGVRATRRLQVYGEGAYARDTFAGILGRASITGGLAYTAPWSRPHSLVAESGVGYTTEQRVEEGTSRYATASGAVHYTWFVARGTQFTEDVTVNEDLHDAGNWRGVSVTAVSVTLSRLLSLKGSHTFEYRHEPVVGFGRTDTRTAVAIVFSLQHRDRQR